MRMRLWLLLAVLGLCCARAPAVEFALSGAKVGEWTMDFAAARKLAAEKNLPLLLNFTGSDWCYWCQLMDRQVFAKPEWQTWATEHAVLVALDFPQDNTKVPEPFRARNQELQKQFAVEGFPTFVVLDSDGERELGRLAAAEDASPQTFIPQMTKLLRARDSERLKLAAEMAPEQAARFREVIARMAAARARHAELRQQLAAATTELEDAEKQVTTIESEHRLAKLTPEQLAEYRAAKADLDKAQQELQAWLESGPQRTPENDAKFKAYRDRMQKAEAIVGKYE